MKLRNMPYADLMEKRKSILSQIERAKGLTLRDLQKALERIDRERVRRVWENL